MKNKENWAIPFFFFFFFFSLFNLYHSLIVRAAIRETVPSDMCDQRRHKSVYTSAQIRILVILMRKLCILGYPKCAHWRIWSDCANAHADLNFRWAHMSEDTFPDVADVSWAFGAYRKSAPQDRYLASCTGLAELYRTSRSYIAPLILPRKNNVATTSLQRCCNVVTLQRRCNDVVCLLGMFWLSWRRVPTRY